MPTCSCQQISPSPCPVCTAPAVCMDLNPGGYTCAINNCPASCGSGSTCKTPAGAMCSPFVKESFEIKENYPTCVCSGSGPESQCSPACPEHTHCDPTTITCVPGTAPPPGPGLAPAAVSSNELAIILGCIGGAIALAIIIGLAVYFSKKKKGKGKNGGSHHTSELH